MPKEKRKKVTGNSKRHAPLGQVIADDENRSKYATVRSRSRASDDKELHNDDYEHDETLLDEKSSRKIFELGREQLLEIEMEEQKNEMERRHNEKNKASRGRSKSGGDSSDDEEDQDDMEGGSIIGDLTDDE